MSEQITPDDEKVRALLAWAERPRSGLLKDQRFPKQLAAAYRAKAAEVEAMRGELANTKAIEGDALMLSENDLRSVRTVETPVQIK